MKLSFKSELLHAERATAEIMSFIDERLPGMPSNERCDLRLVFHELLCNAVVHGNKENAETQVHAVVDISDGLISVEIRDEGPGFDYIKLLAELESEDDLFNERGRGLRIVRWMTDTLVFVPPGNRVRFYKRVAEHG